MLGNQWFPAPAPPSSAADGVRAPQARHTTGRILGRHAVGVLDVTLRTSATRPKAGYLQAPGARGAGQRDRFHHGPGDDGAPWPGRPGGAPIPAGWAPGLRPVRAPTEISLVQRQARLPVPPRTYHRHRSRLRSPPEHLYPRRPDPARGPLPLMDKGSRIAWICHVVTEAGEDLAEPQNISVDIDADLRRTRAHAAACCDSS
jgi:hypothetical protein